MSIPTDLKFAYEQVGISDLSVNKTTDDSGNEVVRSIQVGDREFQVSPRFFTSLFSRFQFNKAFFKYFSHEEVFLRIAEKSSETNEKLRICIQSMDGVDTLLAVSNIAKPVVTSEQLLEQIELYQGDDVRYCDGIVSSIHVPRVGSSSSFKIGEEEFQNRFMVSTPVDGYGQPSIYLGLYCHKSKATMIAMSKQFRSTLNLGKGDDNVAFALTRCFDQFSNEEGHACLRQRIEAAQLSWCSMFESSKLYKLLARIHNKRMLKMNQPSIDSSPTIKEGMNRYNTAMGRKDDSEIGGRLMTAFHGLTGDASELYGVANTDALNDKRQRALPVKCTVFDLLKFAVEVGARYTDEEGTALLNGFVGSLISVEYDLEQTLLEFTEFEDFSASCKLKNNVTGS